MDFALTEEQELLLESIRELLKSFPEEYFKEGDKNHRYPYEFMKALADSGISLLGVPEEFGGTPVDQVTQTLALWEIARCGAPANLVTNGQCIHSMLRFGSKEQLRKTAEATKETGVPGYALALTEPGAGSDSNSATCSYTRRNGKVYLNGQKTFITGALEYPYMVVLARDPNVADTKKCFTLWWIDSKQKGLTVKPLNKVGSGLLSTCEVFLDDVEVEESDMVGKEGEGFVNVMQNFEIERLVNATRAGGTAQCAFEESARYANQRIQFGKPIGFNQLIQEKLAMMAIKVGNMRNMVLRAAWDEDQGISLRTSAALCKLYCAKAAFEVIDDAMQIQGGLGYTEARVGRFWREVRQEQIGGGTSEIMIYVAGRQILKEFKD
jgi:alkylation response protein AidB-like acyl-CoA dehydrogenase